MAAFEYHQRFKINQWNSVEPNLTKLSNSFILDFLCRLLHSICVYSDAKSAKTSWKVRCEWHGTNPFMHNVKKMIEHTLKILWCTHWDQSLHKKFFFEDFLSKCDKIHSFSRIWSYLLKKLLMENFIFCTVNTLYKS